MKDIKDAVIIPEMRLSVDERLEMLHFFHMNKDQYGKEYISSTGRSTGMWVVNEFEPNYIMKRMHAMIPPELYKESAFLANNGIGRHHDASRQCVISFEILNIDREPMNMYYENNIEHVFYNGDTIMWNPQVEHNVAPCQNLRVLYQIELNNTKPFSYYRDLYENGKLFTEFTAVFHKVKQPYPY